MEFNDVIKNRFACKGFSDKQVDETQISAILEAARLAPTAKNLQEYHIYVITNKEMLNKIDEATPCRYNAPLVMCVSYDKNNVFTYPNSDRTSGVEDASIVATHMMLQACNEGLDSCWVNAFNPDNMSQVIGLPDNEEILMLLDLGYKASGVEPLENHFNKKNISEQTTFIK